MSHTKGPWKIDETYGLIVDESNQLEIAALHASANGPKERLANARLIAAAPELLELARHCLSEWEKPTDGVQKGELIARLSNYSDFARALIKKAEGQS